MPPMIAPSPYQTFQARGATYTADANGSVANVATRDVLDMLAMGCLPTGGTIGQRNNLGANTDPGGANDSTQDFAVGSIWINTATSRVWMCMSAAPGAAMWLLDGVVPGVGADPASMLTLFGGLALSANFATFREEGNLYRLIGNPIAGNAADTTDDIVGGIGLDAGAFDVAGRGLCITAQGKFGAAANNKRFKLWANPAMSGQTVTAGVISGGTVTGAGSGVLLYDSGVQTGNNVGWSLIGNLFKYGAAGSNTQYFQAMPIFGATHGGITLPVFSTLTESAIINLVITGASPTTGAANDVVLTFFEVNAMN